jgi:hypothetical protein
VSFRRVLRDLVLVLSLALAATVGPRPAVTLPILVGATATALLGLRELARLACRLATDIERQQKYLDTLQEAVLRIDARIAALEQRVDRGPASPRLGRRISSFFDEDGNLRSTDEPVQ